MRAHALVAVGRTFHVMMPTMQRRKPKGSVRLPVGWTSPTASVTWADDQIVVITDPVSVMPEVLRAEVRTSATWGPEMPYDEVRKALWTLFTLEGGLMIPAILKLCDDPSVGAQAGLLRGGMVHVTGFEPEVPTTATRSAENGIALIYRFENAAGGAGTHSLVFQSALAQADLLAEWEEALDKGGDERDAIRKRIARDLTPRLERAIWLAPLPDHLGQSPKADELALWIEERLESDGFRDSSDANYDATIMRDGKSGKRGALVRRKAREDTPLFPEVVAAAKVRVPAAFRQPLLKVVASPGRLPGSVTHVTHVEGNDPLDSDAQESILSKMEPNEAREEVEDAVKTGGFDALGWYQSCHEYDDGFWGIYLHDGRVRALATDLYHRLLAANCGWPFRALELATEMVEEHERFHALVDAYAALQELASGRPRYRKYSAKVYGLQDSPLEEALANWCAHDAIGTTMAAWSLGSQWDDASTRSVLAYMEDLFERSPPGYRDWRRGYDPRAWRALASHIVTGVLRLKAPALPLEGGLRIFTGAQLDRRAVPVRFTCTTTLGDHLFSTPARREVHQLLRSRGWVRAPRRGKGSHELWQHPTGHGFPLPVRDPLSLVVFSNLLRAVGVTKAEYMDLRKTL